MSDKKLKIMSLSLEPDLYEKIKNASKKMGHKNVSKMIRDLINKYLDLLINDNDETPIIIRVPNEIKENKEELSNWLEIKKQAIIQALIK